eukprot:TRINITY_DN29005_c0_g1_i1.p1 TRINITY_DN29005_c0_g1~~TRINITY_DN29005_c0_g1_i1.p1  ORF type:complete len:270 (-),score=51.83 TRINITY_DN29005_c0_g1_i1:349-1158(-)
MADEHEKAASFLESVMEKVEKVTEKLHDSSSSDSDDEKPKKVVEEHPVQHPVQPKVEESCIKSTVNRLFGREKPVHAVIGGGKTADILLWRNKQVSASIVVGATIIWLLFEVWGYHLLALVCHALMLGISVLFVWSNASTFINKQPAQIQRIQLSEDIFQIVASTISNDINKLLSALHDIASGRDLKKFLTVIAGLWILSVVGSWANFLSLLYFAFVFAHTVPVLYEKYQDQVDAVSLRALDEGKKYYQMFDAQVLSKIPRGPLKDKKQ